IVSLDRVVRGGGHRRQMEVLKVRGAAPLTGVHPFSIDARGFYVYPRLESVVPAAEPAWTGTRAGFGIPEIDRSISDITQSNSQVEAALQGQPQDIVNEVVRINATARNQALAL